MTPSIFRAGGSWLALVWRQALRQRRPRADRSSTCEELLSASQARNFITDRGRGCDRPASLLLRRLHRRAELVGKRAETLGLRLVLLLCVLADLALLPRLEDRFATQLDPPPRRVHVEDDHLDVAPERERLPDVALPVNSALRDAAETRASRRQENENAVRLDPLHLAREAGPGQDLDPGLWLWYLGSRRAPRGSRTLGPDGTGLQHRDANPLLFQIDVQDLDRHRGAGRNGGLPSIPLPRGCEGGHVRQCLDPRLQLHEGAKVGDPGDLSHQRLADPVPLGQRRPGIGLQLLQADRDLSADVLHAENLARDRVTWPDHVHRMPHPRPTHLLRMQQ